MTPPSALSTSLHALERALLAALFAATMAAILVSSRNGLAPERGREGFGLAFWVLLLAAYAAVALAAAVSAAGVAAVLRKPHVLRWLVAAPAGAFLVAALLLNPRAAMGVFDLPGPDPFRWLAPIVLVASAAGLVLVVVLPLARAWALRVLAAAAAVAMWFAVSPAPMPSARTVSVDRPAAARSKEPQRFVLIGLDGADWRYLDPLLARGELPNLAELKARGAWGPLRTLEPTLSPAIWTTIATGVRPRRHGVRGFQALRLQGVDETLPDLHPLRGLGMRPLLDHLRASGRIALSAVSSATRRVPAFWNVATAFGSPVGVVGWWATAPADQVMGHLVSDRYYYESLVARGRPLPPGLLHPESFLADANRLLVLPQDVRYEDTRPFMDVTPDEFRAMQVSHPSPLTGLQHEFTYFLSLFETDRRLALAILEKQRRAYGVPGDLLVLFRIVDKTSHTALQFSELVDEPDPALAEDRRRFGRVITGSYRAVDSAIGDIRKAFPEANVIVVSDHGFVREGRGAYNHHDAPPGVILAAGPAFAARRVDGLSVYDVLPLLLYLKGFPLAEDLEGTLPVEALDPALLARQPMLRVATYGDRYAPRPSGGTAEAEAEIAERLRALGYIQ